MKQKNEYIEEPEIVSDPFGSYTGVPNDLSDPYPVQDADDL